MFIFKLLLALALNPTVLWVAAACALFIFVWGYAHGFGGILKIVANWKTWVVVGFAVMLLTVSDQQKKIETLETQAATAAEQSIAKDDANKTLTKRAAAKDRRAAQQDRIAEAISHAEPDRKLDAALDEIARDQAADAPPADRDSLLDRLLHRKPDGVVRP